jgi:mRNA-degrading endonuclease toxin of MazEF toxin-antitoxin module
MQKLRIELMSLSYHPLHLADVSVRVIAVHRGLALLVCPVLLRHGSELDGHPVAVELVPGLQRLNQQIDLPLKVLLLCQIDPVDLARLQLPLQHLRAKKNYIWMSKSKINNYKVIVEDGK